MTRYIFKKNRWRWLASAIDGVGHVVSGFPSEHKDLPKALPKILVVRLDHVGDMVRATALPQLIKEAYPNTKLIFLTTTTGAQIIDHNPYVDEVILFDPRWYRAGPRAGDDKRSGFRQTAQLLKDRKIDAAILLRGDIRENTLAKLAAIPFRVGYGITGGSFLLSRVVRYRHEAHEDEHTMDILRAIGIEVSALRPRIYLDDSIPDASSKLFSKFEMTPGLPWVGIQMEAGTSAKQWDLQCIHSFIDECSTALLNTNLYFVGQNKEVRKILDDLLSRQKDLRWVNLIGKTSLGELSILMANSRAFVGFDSGPTHMAAAFGLPTLFIYSGTNEFEVWKPLAENATVFKNKVDCSPCHLTKCTVAGHPCLEGVSRTRVLNWIKERL